MKNPIVLTCFILASLFLSCWREDDTNNQLFIVNKTDAPLSITFKMSDVEMDEFTKQFNIPVNDSVVAFQFSGYEGRSPYGYDTAIVLYQNQRFIDTCTIDTFSLLNMNSYLLVSSKNTKSRSEIISSIVIDQDYINAHLPQ